MKEKNRILFLLPTIALVAFGLTACASKEIKAPISQEEITGGIIISAEKIENPLNDTVKIYRPNSKLPPPTYRCNTGPKELWSLNDDTLSPGTKSDESNFHNTPWKFRHIAIELTGKGYWVNLGSKPRQLIDQCQLK